jgi:DNA helicase-2/ATP-dependent DNA helicase PcrA
LKGFDLSDRDARTYVDYVRRLERRNMADFDMLVVKAAHLLQTNREVADEVRARWDYILVDEFQDLNQRQYEVVKALAWKHRNVFAVGDDEQSIFSWTGADNTLFGVFKNDFEIVAPITLRDNHRCPRQVFDLAKSLVRRNPPGPWTKEDIIATRDTAHPVRAIHFGDDLLEGDWLLDDIRADRTANSLRWGDYAVLYRRHEIGDALEASLIGAGIPCRLAQGRAVGDDPVVAYVVATLKVIADPSGRREPGRVPQGCASAKLARPVAHEGGAGRRRRAACAVIWKPTRERWAGGIPRRPSSGGHSTPSATSSRSAASTTRLSRWSRSCCRNALAFTAPSLKRSLTT